VRFDEGTEVVRPFPTRLSSITSIMFSSYIIKLRSMPLSSDASSMPFAPKARLTNSACGVKLSAYPYSVGVIISVLRSPCNFPFFTKKTFLCFAKKNP
jgi:hypothetical protein